MSWRAKIYMFMKLQNLQFLIIFEHNPVIGIVS